MTVYSVVREMILDDLSARRPDRLARASGDIDTTVYRALRQTDIFQNLAFDRHLSTWNWQTGPRSEIVWGIESSPNFFEVLGVGPSLGRLYSQAAEGRSVAVVSYGFWRRRLGGDPNILGRALILNGHLNTLVGVLPSDYRSIYGHGVSPEVYVPSGFGGAGCRIFGRLRDGDTRWQAQQRLAAALRPLVGKDLARQISVLRPMSGLAANAAKSDDEWRFFLFFVMLFSVSGALAVIACSNVAGLLLARGASRKREIAIRRAMGANRRQIVRQLLAEGMVLVAGGAVLGLLLDSILRSQLSTVRWPSAYGLPFEFHFHQDAGLLLYAAVTACGGLMVSSLIPAWRGSQTDLALAMKQGEPAFSVRHWNGSSGFVAAQVILSMVLLTLGALFTRSLVKMAMADPGFDIGHTLIVGFQTAHKSPEQVFRRIGMLPGVLAVTSIRVLPLAGEMPKSPFRRSGDPLSSARDVYRVGVGPQYCRAAGMRILRGRDLETRDGSLNPAPVVVNETLAHQFFAGSNPLGEHLLVGLEKERMLDVVGVVADAMVRTAGEGKTPAFYIEEPSGALLVRVAGNPGQWREPLRSALGEMDPTAGLDVRPMGDAVAGVIFPMRVASGFLGALSGIGLILALIGLYSSVSYATGRRTREMGIRLAMGATRAGIVWVAARDGIAVLVYGAIAGLAFAIAIIRNLVDLLPDGVSPWNPVMLTVPALLLLAAGMVAAWIAARRAARTDPAVALRQD